MKVAPNADWVVLSKHLSDDHGYGIYSLRDMSAIQCYDAHVASHATGKSNHTHSESVNTAMQSVHSEIKSIYGVAEPFASILDGFERGGK